MHTQFKIGFIEAQGLLTAPDKKRERSGEIRVNWRRINGFE